MVEMTWRHIDDDVRTLGEFKRCLVYDDPFECSRAEAVKEIRDWLLMPDDWDVAPDVPAELIADAFRSIDFDDVIAYADDVGWHPKPITNRDGVRMADNVFDIRFPWWGDDLRATLSELADDLWAHCRDLNEGGWEPWS